MYGGCNKAEENLAGPVELDGLEAPATDPVLEKPYAGIAECYLLLAIEGQRLIEQGEIESDTAANFDRREMIVCKANVFALATRSCIIKRMTDGMTMGLQRLGGRKSRAV
jgi:hypothetical protein